MANAHSIHSFVNPTHSFPILRLPFLPLQAVIQRMPIADQIHFSALSKISKWVVRIGTSRKKMRISFTCGATCSIVITDSYPYFGYKLGSDRNPSVDEMKELIIKMSEVFKTVSIDLFIFQGSPYRTNFELIPISKQLNVPLDLLYILSNVSNDELCSLALEVGKNAKQFHSRCQTSPNFHPQELGTFNFENLYLHPASWVTLDHLVNNFLNCHKVSLINSEIPLENVNEFIKKWIGGSEMRDFRWKPSQGEPALPTVLNGIPCVAVKKATITVDMGLTETREFGNDECFLIEQVGVGGVKAIIYSGYWPVIMTTKFSLD